MADLAATDIDAIEAMIDKSDLRTVLDAIVAICQAKADHLRTNWQDQVDAGAWEHDARRIELACDTLWEG